MASQARSTGTDPKFVVSLREVGRNDIDLVGGKGANLGELIRGGFQVPPGFAVTTNVYGRFVESNSLQDVISHALDDEQQGGARIRAAFGSARIPPEIEQQILAAYGQLDRGPVAVRSSGTAEDLPEAAFAGQQDTFLNVVGEDALLDAVRRCWASLWSDRAITYRKRQGMDRQTARLSVVVQRMVDAEVAGVMFTANPVTGARDETVLDASPGLGEAVVSGLVTPDHYVLARSHREWRIVEQRVGRREVVVRPTPGGGTERVSSSAEVPTRPSLSERAPRMLARLGKDIEQHFGAPQDIEWAWAGGRPYILQARPITALPEPPPHASRVEQAVARMFLEMVPVRPYPLDMTTWVPALSRAATRPVFSVLGIGDVDISRLFVQEDAVVVRFRGGMPVQPTPAVLLAPLRLLRLALRYDPARWRSDPVRARALSRLHAMARRDPRALSPRELLSTARASLALILPAAGEPRRRYLPRVFLSMVALRIWLGLLRRGELFGTLMWSGVENKTAAANRELEDLAAEIRSDPLLAEAFASRPAGQLWAALEETPEGRSFLENLRDFLDHHGHRETRITGPSQPTWKDAPHVVFGILKGLAAAEPKARAGPPDWQVARDEALSLPIMRVPPLRSVFLRLLSTARYLLQIREDTHFDALLVLPILRQTLLELGRRVAGEGTLDQPEDIFYLTLADLSSVPEEWPPPQELSAKLRSLATRRKQRLAALEAVPLVDPRLFAGREPSGDVLLRGTSGSPGVAEGPARVIRSEEEFGKLRPGEVLVAPYTNPAWTPLFQRAVAVVVDSGSAASHAAIVAREYRIPAVMGTIDGTRKLTDGLPVRVDGHRGLVTGVVASG